MDKMIYPEIFITGELPEGWTKEKLVADGLVGWANCSFTKPPKNFGKGMALIGKQTGASLADELMVLADEILKDRVEK